MTNSSGLRYHCIKIFITLFLLGFAGCTRYYLLLDEEDVKKINFTRESEHHIILFSKAFTYTTDGKLMEKTHQIFRVGENPSSFIPALSVLDISYRKLSSVEGRVMHSDGTTEKFSQSDFLSFNLSNQRVISDENLRQAFVERKLKTGDLVEIVSIHEMVYPDLGIEFSLGELDYSAENITCSIETNRPDNIRYRVVNCNVTPSIVDSITRKISFHWDSYRQPKQRRDIMEKKNQSPTLLAIRSSRTWQSFGDWYLQLIAPKLQPNRAFMDSAARITQGKSTPKEKMDAIFDYCQRNVRYEQVYFKLGGQIPHDVNEILDHKYGDCKDYACLMYAMAGSVGIKTNLVLCYRGRGEEFFEDMPVSQFNHAILYFKDGGRDYWYDGTNRAGLPGITTFDLVNARALILEENNSRLSVIEDSPDNRLTITGTFSKKGKNGLKGELNAVFSNQFAIDWFWLEHQTNEEQLAKALKQLLTETINENIVVDSLRWKSKEGSFTVSASCELPNCITDLHEKSYTSIGKIFPELLPHDMEKEEESKIFYFPFYNRVWVNVNISAADRPVTLQYQFQLPAGPFTDSTRAGFLNQLDSVITDMNKFYTLPGVSQQ